MEILSHNSVSSYQLVSLSSKAIDKGSGFIRIDTKRCRRVEFPCGSLRKSRIAHLKFKNRKQRSGFRTLDAFRGVGNFKSRISSGCYSAYVTEGGKDGTRVYEKGESGSRIVIPGLPDESKGEFGARISSCYWEWKPKLSVHYERAGMENVDSPAVLFLPGFGVGSFHYEKQLKDLGRDYRVWAVDFLGQGRSLPVEDPAPLSENRGEYEGKESSLWGFGDETEPWASDLVYSTDLWRDQVQDFVEQVVGEPVYVVGNSLGGFVSLYFAASNPELVKGVALLNATPFWGFLPNPARSPGLAKLFPWAGTFPLPANVRKLTAILWQKISDPRSIAEVLQQVYSDHSTKVDNVFSRILETTEHPAAAASLASIMFAPRGKLSFKEALLGCQANKVPICLMYGREDPWVTPLWGRRVKWQLPEVPYYEISPAGHCPHDEVPEVVNYLIRGWIKNNESNGSVFLPLLDYESSMQQNVYRELQFSRQGSKRSIMVRSYGTMFSLWRRLSSFIKYGHGNSTITT